MPRREVILTLAVHYKGNITPTVLTKIAIKSIIIWYKENIIFTSKKINDSLLRRKETSATPAMDMAEGFQIFSETENH